MRTKQYSAAAAPLISAVNVYRNCLSPSMMHSCRFVPSCSSYALQALQQRGAWQGSWLTIRRLLRCHPFSGQWGVDPVQ